MEERYLLTFYKFLTLKAILNTYDIAVLWVKAHPARFPEKLPAFFIQFLTEPGDIVLDIFAGSNTTGAVAEQAGRHWLAFERDKKYLLASTFRFIDELSPNELIEFWSNAISSKNTIELMRSQQEMVLMEESAEYKANGRRWA